MFTSSKVASVLDFFVGGGEEIDYQHYCLNDTHVKLGIPPIDARGVDFVAARYLAAQNTLFQCLTGKGVFASNENTSGVIELGVLNGSVTQGHIDIMQLTGIPFPINLADTSSGGTSVVTATGCRMLEIPEWRRDAFPGVVVYTFTSSRMYINHGLRLPVIVS